MKKIIIGIVAAIILGVGGWLLSLLFIDKKVSEDFPVQTSGASQPQEVFQGSFEGFDRIHYGSGDVKVFKTDEGYVIRFEENFNVANGPALVVGFGKDGEYQKGSDIAELKGNVGSQNYILPPNINLDDYNEIWIWCKAFAVGFAKAPFK